MADYDLGTAHGKIRVEYEDKGFKAADKDMTSLMDRAKSMAGTLSQVKNRWGKDFGEMTDNTTKFASAFGAMTGLVALSVGTFSRAGQSLQTLGGAGEIVNSLGLALGGVPEGAENFPSVIKKIIQMAAAIALFRGSMFLLAGLAGRFRALRFASPLLRGLGSSAFALAAPLRLISGLALDVAFAIREFRLVKQIAKWVVLATGAFAGLGGAIWVVTGLADAIKQLSGLVGFLPGIVLAAAIAFGAAKIAFSGFMDAVKSGDLSKISKEAGVAVTAIRSFEGQWNSLKMAVQDKFFAGMGEEIREVGGILMPIMQKGLVGVAGALRNGAMEIGAFFRTAQTQKDLQVAFGLTETVVRNLTETVRPLLQVFMDVAIVGLGLLTDMTSGAGESARGFADMVREARETGKLADWMRNGVQALKDLWGAAKAVASAMTTIFTGLNGGESTGFLQSLRTGAESMKAFFESAKGQEVLATLSSYLQHAQENIRKLADAFVTHILPAIQAFMPVMQALSDAVINGLIAGIAQVAPLFVAMGTALGPIAPLLGFILKGMVATATVIMGLFLAFKILGAVFLIVNSGFRALKGAAMVAGFALRLFTGTLRQGEIAALRFAWTLIKSIGRGIKTWIIGIAQGIATNVAWVASTIWGAITTAATWIWAKTVLIATWIATRVAAAASATWTAIVWVAQAIWARVTTIAVWVAFRVALFALWLTVKVQAAIAAIQTGLAWIAATISSTASVVATWIAARVSLVATWLWLKIQAAISAIGVGLAWLGATISSTASIVATWIATRVSLVATWLWLKIQAAISAIGVGLAWIGATISHTASIVASWIAARVSIMITWLTLKIQAAITAIGVGIAWIGATISSTATIVATWVSARVSIIVGWVMMRIAAVGAAIGIAITWITTQIPAIATVVAAWIGARITAAITWISMAASALASAAVIAGAWLLSIWPIALVVAAVVAVGVAIWYFWDDIKAAFQAGATWVAGKWAEITAWFSDAMAKIGAAIAPFQGIIDMFTLPFRVAGEIISTVWNVIVALFTGNFSAIGGIVASGGQRILGLMKGAMTGIGNAVSSGISTVLGWFAGLPGRAMSALGNLAGTFARAGVSMISGIVNGLSSAAGRVISFLTGLAQRALNSILSFFGIASPSKVFHWIGEMLGRGWLNGLRSMKDKVVGEAASMATAVKDAVTVPMLDAAAEILKQMEMGGRVFEDFSFAGMSSLVGEQNDALIDLMKKSGMKDPRMFLEHLITKSNGGGSAQVVAPPRFDPYARATGGDGAVAPIDMSGMSVTIDAQSVAEMNSVVDFFDKVQQSARAGKAGS